MEESGPVVVMKTSLGDVELQLDPQSPKTVENFLQYVDDGHYDRTVFHRVISNFMIQGGGFSPGMKEKPTRAPVRNEAHNGLKNQRGTIAMARTSDVDSATSQFFINVQDNDFLNHRNTSPEGYGYCVFGRVTSGMDIVDKIRQVPTQSAGRFDDVPVDDVVIESIRRK